MLTDITLGQYIPRESPVHNLDPRIKIIATFVFIVAVFLVKSVYSYIFLFGFTAGIILISKISFSTVIKSIKPIVVLVLFTAFINIFMSGGDDVAFKLGFVTVTYTGIKIALAMSLRLIFLVMGTSMLTYTTAPILLTDGIEKLLSPLKKIGFPSHELAMMMTIALRFIPTLFEETDKIIRAQKARGADFESGNVIKRTKALIPVLVPLFINSFRRADELALAMECRCYRGGDGRTRLKQLKIQGADIIALLVVAIFVCGILLLNKI